MVACQPADRTDLGVQVGMFLLARRLDREAAPGRADPGDQPLGR